MKFLTGVEVAEWRAKHAYLFAGNSFGGKPLASKPVDVNFESKQTEAYAVARRLALWLLVYEDQAMAEIFEHGIWPSSENLHLYYVWRRSHGDHRLIEDAPGHVFLKHEVEDLATLLQLSFLFGWGLCCAVPRGERRFRVDHDGHGLVVATSEDQINEALGVLQ